MNEATTAPMAGTDAGTHFRDGRLADAIEAAGRAVKLQPGTAAPRVLLAELLLFTGNFARADAVLDAAEAADPSAALVIAEFRQLLRAAAQRQKVFTEGQLPEFLGAPAPAQRHALAALVAVRAGDAAAATVAAAAAEAARPSVAGRMGASDGDVAFDDFRDADDVVGGTIEALTTTGKYFWIPTDRMISMEFHPTTRPRDLLWRRCTMVVRDGPDGDVYVPALYDMPPDATDLLRLGRATNWTDTAPVRGSGQRVFLVGNDGFPIQQLTEIEFT